jgi:hypothetical protein
LKKTSRKTIIQYRHSVVVNPVSGSGIIFQMYCEICFVYRKEQQYYQSLAMKSQVYKFVAKVPNETTNGKKVRNISLVLIGSHRKSLCYFTPRICKLRTVGLTTGLDPRRVLWSCHKTSIDL